MKRKGYLLATASSATAAAIGGNAQAADLPMKSPPPPPAPVASWTGFYVGVNAGANWQMNSAAYSGTRAGSLPASSVAGFIGGGQIGYNWQASPKWVLGIEATIDGLTGKAIAPNGVFSKNKGNSFQSQITWMATLRGRAGWLMSANDMLYATAGGAWAHINELEDPNGLSANDGPAFTHKSVNKTKAGWVAGGGMEHMFDAHWSLGLEVLYADFGTTVGTAARGSKTTNFKNSVATGQLKLNYKF